MKNKKNMLITLAVTALTTAAMAFVPYLIPVDTDVFIALSYLLHFSAPVLLCLLGAIIYRYTEYVFYPALVSAGVLATCVFAQELFATRSDWAQELILMDAVASLLIALFGGLCVLLGALVCRIVKKALKVQKRGPEEETEKKAMSSKTVYLLFVLAILAVGLLLMIISYEYYFDTSADILPGYFLILACLPIISLIFLFVAYMIKIRARSRVRFTALALIAMLLPATQFIFNFSVLPALRTLPGIYHFFALCEGDYNFDGVNDKLYDLNHNERTVEVETTIPEDDKTPFSKIVTVTTGTGLSLDSSNITLWQAEKKMNYTMPAFCEIKSVDVYITFDTASDADKYEFLINISDYNVVLNGEVIDDGRLKLSLPCDHLENMKNVQEHDSYSVRCLIYWRSK